MNNETKRNVTQSENDKRNECRFCREIPEDCSCSRGKLPTTHRFLDTADMNRPGLDD